MEITGFDFFQIDHGNGELQLFQADYLKPAKEFMDGKEINSILYYGNILEPGIEREHVYEETLTKGDFDVITNQWLDDRRKRTVEAWKNKYRK